ncbi:hypothetical protein [Streptomyces sp. enrichment culture]|uniref:hypothetical protein n=1 Tax=Streptomyces sp. enrichment culture TaxID=1795815 RepID=UPI003F552FF1
MEQLLAWWRASALRKFGKQVVDGLLQRCRAVGVAIRFKVSPLGDTAFAAGDVAEAVFTVRDTFARRHVLAEARRHLLEILRGQEFTRGLGDYIAGRALSHHSRQLTVPQPGRESPAFDQLTYIAGFVWPGCWRIAGAGGKPPRAVTRYERAKIASITAWNAIRAARTTGARDDTPITTAPTDHHDRAAEASHGVDHPGRDAALTQTQRAAAVHAHQQAVMPQEYLEGHMTDPVTWMRTPARPGAAHRRPRAADARRRTTEDRELPAPAADPRRQEHE